MKTIFLTLSVLITVASALPYMRDIVRGLTKPNLVSWITWSLLTGVATAAAISAHEYVAAIFTGAATLETILIVALGISRGYVKYTRFDIFCQVGAIVGIVLWQTYNSPSVGVIAAVAIDFVGALPTFVHAWREPEEETWLAFALAALALGALSNYNWVTLPYAVYIIIVNAGLSYVIITRKRKLVGTEA